MHSSRGRFGATVVAFGLVIVACGGPAPGRVGGIAPSPSVAPLDGGNKVGTVADAVVLKVGNNDGPTGPGPDAIRYFATEVERRSAGRVTVEEQLVVGDGVLEYNQRLAEMVKDGALDLAIVPARAFDRLGVTSLQALQAPFLLTDDDAVDTVVNGPLAGDLMSGLPDAGYEGLALWPADLRHPFSHEGPVVALSDFAGRQFIAPSSLRSFELLTALGARPVDWGLGGPRDIGAVEMPFGQLGNLGISGFITANVTLYPKIYTLVAARDAFRRLSPADQAILRDAALATTAWAARSREHEPAAIAAFCRQPLSKALVLATDRELTAIVAASAPIYRDLESDPLTNRLIAEIRTVMANQPDATEAIKPCGSAVAGSPAPSIDPATIGDPAVLNGVYRAELSAAYLESRGVDKLSAVQNGGTWTLTFANGTFHHHLDRDDSECVGPYVVTDRRVTVTMNQCNHEGVLFSATWTLTDDELRLTDVEPGDALAQAGWGGKPFAWIQDVP